ncbi:hypothetical protein BDV96DRAFT_604727 [Lophiotrema nucula]|uniref:Uncharacterized protein n=1 Tax=Lophiotrema nucula TaxID=690887 RepID=A0A6A5YQU8_9PLEO|nr:hypothetical protein BDV96DRAFT_604727 [Lophiotrema nucula]
MAPKRKQLSGPPLSTAKTRTLGTPRPIEGEMRSYNGAQASPFFTKLNYDVRCVIYDYLEYPPISSGRETVGIILSCHQAFAETSEAVARQFSARLKYLSGLWEECYGHELRLFKEIDLHGGFSKLKELTLRFSTDDLKKLCSCKVATSLSFTMLLSMWLDKVTLYICADAAEFAGVGNWHADDAAHDLNIPRFLRCVGTLIEQQSSRNTQGNVNMRQADKCNTKIIAMAWNYLHNDSDTRPPPRKLTGRVWKYSTAYLNRRREKDMYIAPRSADHHPQRYEVKGRNDRVGEAGLRCETRWNFESDVEMGNLWQRYPRGYIREPELISMKRWQERDDFALFRHA